MSPFDDMEPIDSPAMLREPPVKIKSVSPWAKFMEPVPPSLKSKRPVLELDGVMNLIYDCYDKRMKVLASGSLALVVERHHVSVSKLRDVCIFV